MGRRGGCAFHPQSCYNDFERVRLHLEMATAGFLSLPEDGVAMEKKNPLIAGLLNMLVPGSSYLYVDNDLGRFIKTLIAGIIAIAVMLFLGNTMQHSLNYPLPQGLCPGILLLIVLVPLFLNGQKTANRHNMVMDNAARFDARQHGTDESQLARNQELRDKRMISEQEYESRKDDISSKE